MSTMICCRLFNDKMDASLVSISYLATDTHYYTLCMVC